MKTRRERATARPDPGSVWCRNLVQLASQRVCGIILAYVHDEKLRFSATRDARKRMAYIISYVNIPCRTHMRVTAIYKVEWA